MANRITTADLDIDNDTLLTPDEVAKILRVGRNYLYGLARRGTGPAYVKVGQYVRYPRAALEQWINTNATASGNVSGNKSPDAK